jgi:hypothetical protein
VIWSRRISSSTVIRSGLASFAASMIPPRAVRRPVAFAPASARSVISPKLRVALTTAASLTCTSMLSRLS